jgi:predicted Rossmann fold nucleotide-binding protein DprA/Smf involved in DNA uptake
MKKTGEKPLPRAKREIAIVTPDETADLKFRESGAISPYKDLLEELQDAPKGSTLRIARSARYTALKHIRELGLKVLWGKKGDILYIKIVGTEEPPLTVERALKMPAPPAAETNGARKVGSAQRLLLTTLHQNGPATLKDLARVLGVSAMQCSERLAELRERGLVECEDNVWREKTAAKTA